MRLRVAEPSLLVRASGAPSSSRVAACGRERKHGITHRSCGKTLYLAQCCILGIQESNVPQRIPVRPNPVHFTTPRLKQMGLGIGGSFAGTFGRDFSRTSTDLAERPSLQFLFANCVLFTLLVLCGREPPPSASAERFLCVHARVSKFERPSGRHDAGVFEAHWLKLVRVRDRVSPGRHVARPTSTPRSDKRSHFEAGGRRKARAPAECTTAPPRASKRVEATRVGGPELVHSAVEGMRGRDTVQRGRAPPRARPSPPHFPANVMSGFAPRGSHAARRGSSVLPLWVPGPRG